MFKLTLLLLFFVAMAKAGPAPDFSLPLLDESATTVSLADYRGKIIYLDFWASWCGPCKISLPLLNDLYNELGDQGFTVLAVNVDENVGKAEKFLKRFPVDYPVLLDTDASTARAYHIVGMPTSVIIDQAGNIVMIHQGFKESDIDLIRGHVQGLIKPLR